MGHCNCFLYRLWGIVTVFIYVMGHCNCFYIGYGSLQLFLYRLWGIVTVFYIGYGAL